MEQRVSLITLGVADLARARAFYEALGWTSACEAGSDVVFFQAGGMVVALWDRATLAADSGVTDGHPWEVAHNSGWVLQGRRLDQALGVGRGCRPTSRSG